MKTIDYEQGSQEWHDWRMLGVGASEAGIILAKPGAYKTAYQLFLEKALQVEPDNVGRNPYVLRGKNREDEVRMAATEYLEQLAEYSSGFTLEAACAEHDQYPFIHASFDGLIDGHTPVELKFLSDSKWDDAFKRGRQSEVYQLHEAQVHQQCLVAGAAYGWLMLYKEDGFLLPFKITPTANDLQVLTSAVNQFWQDVQNHVAPPKDQRRDYFAPETLSEQLKWRRLRLSYVPIRERRLQLEQEVTALKNQEAPLLEEFVALMQDFDKARFAGVQVNRIDTTGAVDYRAYSDALLDIIEPFAEADRTVASSLPEEVDYKKVGRSSIRGSLYAGETLDDKHAVLLTNPSYFF